MKRTLLPLEISTMKVRMRNNQALQDLESDLIAVCEHFQKLDKSIRKKDFEKLKKIVYLDKYEYDKNSKVLYIRFKSARYAKCREVIDTKTLKSKGVLKKKVDGDEEKTHMMIKFEEDNKAICIFEKNSDGVGVGQLFEYINSCIIKYHDVKKDNVFYSLLHENIVSKEFLEALENAKRIKGVTLTVEQKDLKVSSAKSFAGRDDLSEDVDIYYRPSGNGKSIKGDTVKEFYKLYNRKNRKVKRITVKADDDTENPITFDTEKIKEKSVVDVEETITGEVREESIKEKLLEHIQWYGE